MRALKVVELTQVSAGALVVNELIVGYVAKIMGERRYTLGMTLFTTAMMDATLSYISPPIPFFPVAPQLSVGLGFFLGLSVGYFQY